MTSSIEGCLLVLIIDVHPQLAINEEIANHYLNSCISFANFHIATNANNRLAVISANHQKTHYLYPRVSEDQFDRQKDGRLEELGKIDDSILKELHIMMKNEETAEIEVISSQTESLISGAICRALLYIKQQETRDDLHKKIHARILVIKASTDTGSQYLNYINTYLTAQKMGTPIDVCVIGNDCGLLQQGADITGGCYYRLKEMTELLETLILLFQPDVGARKKLNTPQPDPVDYRAACFCHRTLVDMGNVCSNCLSVYCKVVPLCSTCNVIFQMDRPLSKTNKKRR